MQPEPTTPNPNDPRRIALALVVGTLIGVIFTALNLPVPVPHGLAGLFGLIGMFAGGQAANLVIAALAARQPAKGEKG